MLGDGQGRSRFKSLACMLNVLHVPSRLDWLSFHFHGKELPHYVTCAMLIEGIGIPQPPHSMCSDCFEDDHHANDLQRLTTCCCLLLRNDCCWDCRACGMSFRPPWMCQRRRKRTRSWQRSSNSICNKCTAAGPCAQVLSYIDAFLSLSVVT